MTVYRVSPSSVVSVQLTGLSGKRVRLIILESPDMIMDSQGRGKYRVLGTGLMQLRLKNCQGRGGIYRYFPEA